MIRRCTATLALLMLPMAMLTSTAEAAPGDEASQPVVTNIVDGDTVDVSLDGATTRIRFLNVNTPEVGRCLSDRATSFTAAHIPPGSVVSLHYDQERTDYYGRTLAFVVNADKVELSVALAKAGLGAPMLIEPNDRYYARVERAAAEAKHSRRGLFNPKRDCTVANDKRQVTNRANKARRMPVRSQRQYRRVLIALAVANRSAHKIRTTRYGVKGAWFARYVRSARSDAKRSVRTVRTAKKFQRARIVRAQKAKKAKNKKKKNKHKNPGGYWPPGVPSNYNGPRCYAPGGVVWRPC